MSPKALKLCMHKDKTIMKVCKRAFVDIGSNFKKCKHVRQVSILLIDQTIVIGDWKWVVMKKKQLIA